MTTNGAVKGQDIQRGDRNGNRIDGNKIDKNDIAGNDIAENDVGRIPSALAIQCLPMGIGEKEKIYAIVDRIIQDIDASGLSYQVGPFETVIEGPLDTLLSLAGRLHKRLLTEGVTSAATYMKLWSGKNMGTSEEKTAKYRK